MLAQLVEKPFDDKAWIFERKIDGVRLIAVKIGDQVTLWTRNQKNRTRQFPEIAAALVKLPNNFVLDGEAAVYIKGVSSFQLIQPRVQQMNQAAINKLVKKYPAVYEVFDILELNGKDLKSKTLTERKKILHKVLKNSRAVRVLPHIMTFGRKLFQKAKREMWEGIIGKKKTGHYLPGKRGHGWVKIKAVNEQELVIGGFSKGYGKAGSSFGALLVGYYLHSKLVFAGEVGTGFSDEERQMLKTKLMQLKTAKSPFDNPPKVKEITWVRPILVGQFRFAEWTRDNLLRVPVYLGLRTDKKAEEVVQEK